MYANIYINVIILCFATSQKGEKQSCHFATSTNIFREGVISESQSKEWFPYKKSGGTSLKDKPGRG